MKETILFTDFYELTMAYGYWKTGIYNTPAVFTFFYRNNPFSGGYAVFAGLEKLVNFLRSFSFSKEELDYISGLKTSSGNYWFSEDFLKFLESSQFQCDVDAMNEGSVVFPYEPLIKVKGPLWQCQLIESAMLNFINFETLIATKASRILWASQGGSVIEFGLRRAQGTDGALSATRAAFIGGVRSTSNMLAAKLLGIPLKGTHAHSWIMAFENEEEAFRKYAENMPDDCVLLIDTFDTLKGAEKAIKIALELKKKGKSIFGMRIDSGDLAYLSNQLRKMLDKEGLNNVKIIASNELDEYVISSLIHQGAKIDIWGVGTKLVTGGECSALNGVYKLAAIKKGNFWEYKIKISNQPSKTTNPGIPKVIRFYNNDGIVEGDLIYDESEEPKKSKVIFDPLNPHRKKNIKKGWQFKELLVPIFDKGKCLYSYPSLIDIHSYAEKELKTLHPSHRRFENPHEYPVGLSEFLIKTKEHLINELLGGNSK